MFLKVLNNNVPAKFLIICNLLRLGSVLVKLSFITNSVVISSVGIWRVDCIFREDIKVNGYTFIGDKPVKFLFFFSQSVGKKLFHRVGTLREGARCAGKQTSLFLLDEQRNIHNVHPVPDVNYVLRWIPFQLSVQFFESRWVNSAKSIEASCSILSLFSFPKK